MQAVLSRGALTLLLACPWALVCAQSAENAASSQSPRLTQVTDCAGAIKRCSLVGDKKLSSMRGGYDAGNGLQISVGIERITYVNGQLVTQTQLTLQDLGKLNASQTAALAALPDARGLVQLGAGNSVRIDQQPATATIIQNSLDNQSIRNLTVINAASNSLQLLRGANPQLTLRDALTLPLGVR